MITKDPEILLPLLNDPEINPGLMDGVEATQEFINLPDAIFYVFEDMVFPVRTKNGCAVIHAGVKKCKRGKIAVQACKSVIDDLKKDYKVLTTIRIDRKPVRSIASILFNFVEYKDDLAIYEAKP